MSAAQKSNVMKFPEKSPYETCTADTYTSCKLPKGVPDWWANARLNAYERFKEQGLPTQKLERFKYTNIAKHANQWDGILAEPKVEFASEHASSLVDKMEHDQWVKDLLVSEPPGMNKYGDSALWDLNSAYLRDGGVVDIPAGEIVDKPITIKISAEDDTFTSLRFILRLGDNASAVLIEEFDGEGEYWRNRVSQIILGQNARLQHIIIHKDSYEALHTQYTHVRAARNAHYDGFTLNLGADVMRHQIHADLDGSNGHVSFNGLNLLNGKQHADTTILVNHRAPHCESNQFYRSILGDASHGVFQGKVHVFQEAQKTDGYQLSNAILLSEKAEMSTKPELEIYADDVKCSHGATTGQLDEEPLFYLRSRGLTEKEARFLLIQAFVGEVLEKIHNDEIRASVEKDVMEWLTIVL